MKLSLLPASPTLRPPLHHLAGILSQATPPPPGPPCRFHPTIRYIILGQIINLNQHCWRVNNNQFKGGTTNPKKYFQVSALINWSPK